MNSQNNLHRVLRSRCEELLVLIVVEHIYSISQKFLHGLLKELVEVDLHSLKLFVLKNLCDFRRRVS